MAARLALRSNFSSSRSWGMAPRWLLHRAGAGRAICSSQDEGSSERFYLQQSRVPTMHFQPSLPHLPVPALSDTLQRYLAALAPVMSAEQLEASRKLADECGKEGRVGFELDKLLRQRDKENKHTSYISEPWYHMYLASRDPLVLNYNPFMAWKENPHTSDQAVRAVNFLRAAVLFRNSLEAGLLEPDVYHMDPQKSDTELFRNIVRLVPSSLSWYMAYLWKAFPLDMSQYGNLLCSTRVPRSGYDELISHPGASHVVVMRNGHFYSLDVVQSDGYPVPAGQLHSQLQWILEQPSSPPPHPLSYLTATDRDDWASIRMELVGTSDMNRRSLHTVDSCIFLLCLDDSEPQDEVDLTHRMLHNYGANRWFDKSVSLILDRRISALNFEHAWGDGVAVLRFFNELHKYSTTEPYLPGTATIAASGEGVHQLEFHLTDKVKAAIERCRGDVEQQCRSLSVKTLEYDRFGSDFVKESGLKADAFVQLALQVAYYRQYKQLVPSYESCSTAAFRHGRTETIRPASSAALYCAQLMESDNSADVGDMMEAVRTATKYHFDLTRKAAMGQGFDRHLFALRKLAEESGQEVELFQDPAYHHLNHIILSTSTLSTNTVLIGGFAPVTPDGYGIGYNVSEDVLGFNVTTYPSRDGAQFCSNLKQVLDDLHSLCSGRDFRK